MHSPKRILLESFDLFLENFQNDNYGKCYFTLVNGSEFQGWILEIREEEILCVESGIFSENEFRTLLIEEIDTQTLTYWDDEISQWITYYVPDKLENRKKHCK